jgi:hypothetical protein
MWPTLLRQPIASLAMRGRVRGTLLRIAGCAHALKSTTLSTMPVLSDRGLARYDVPQD